MCCDEVDWELPIRGGKLAQKVQTHCTCNLASSTRQGTFRRIEHEESGIGTDIDSLTIIPMDFVEGLESPLRRSKEREEQQQLQPLHASLAKATAQPGNSADPSLDKSGFRAGTQGKLTPRPSPGCQSGVRRQSSGVMRHLLEHVGYLAKPLDLVRVFCHRGREAIMFCAFEKVGGQVRGMRTAQFALLVSH